MCNTTHHDDESPKRGVIKSLLRLDGEERLSVLGGLKITIHSLYKVLMS